jgi:hypothetical protein
MTPDQETKRVSHWLLCVLAIAFLTTIVLTQLSSVASAADISNLDNEIGSSLGIGDVAGGLVIVIAAILCVDLVLGVVGVQFQLMIVVDVLMAGLFTAIGWLDAGVFVIILVIVALLFSPKIAQIFWPGGAQV